MKSDVETLSPTRVKLTVEVPFEELRPSMDAAYRTIGGQVSIPGFRKGKVPPRVIDQRFGRGAVLQEAVNTAVPEFYGRAATEAEIRPLGRPEVDVTDVPDGAEGELRFTVEVDVRPEITLPDFSTLSVSIDDTTVDDEDVAAKVEALRERFGTLVGVDRAAADGDFVSVDVAAVIDGDEIDSAKGLSYRIGSGDLLPGIDEALVGASAGQTVTFTAPLAGGDRAGEDADVTVVLQSVKERELPEVDDEFAELASEFDTVDELRADLRRQAEQEKRYAQGVVARDRVLEALLEAVDVPVPDALVEAEVTSHLEGESRTEDDEHRAEVTESTTKALRTQFVLDAVVETQDVSVEQQEFVEFLVSQAPRYGMDVNAFASALQESGQMPAMIAEVRRRKALAVVLEAATVLDHEGNVVDLDDLVPGQPDGADETEAEATDPATADATGEGQDPEGQDPEGQDPGTPRAQDDPTRL